MLVYLAGPIRPKDGKTMEQNVADAKAVALSFYDTAVYGIIGMLVRKGAWGK